MNTEKHDLAHYMALPYTKLLRPDTDGDIVARIVELPGCSAHGENAEEALENLQEAQRLWLEDCIEAGDPVPEPEKEDPLPSGKWVQRVPRSLHQRLVRAAKSERVSLNQLVTSMLSERLSLHAVEKALGQLLTAYAQAGDRQSAQSRSNGAQIQPPDSVPPRSLAGGVGALGGGTKQGDLMAAQVCTEKVQ
ncbi:MAG: type II toxin-antitoxin system HicB family antitoxin [Bryobacteraceae bacterium]|jgi:predicted RNase H-like HicB family nuclease